MLSRRSLLRAVPLLIAAPAIVRAASLMPVKVLYGRSPAMEVLALQERWIDAVAEILGRDPMLRMIGRSIDTPDRPWFSLSLR